MQVDLFILCDAATFGSGKVNVLGVFDCISAVEFPCNHDSFSVVAKVRFSPQDGTHHVLTINRSDSYGDVIDASKREEFDLPFDGLATRTYSIIWNLRGEEFSKPTEELFSLHVDEQCVATVPLSVRLKGGN